eukprot:1159183-Pelagomonas_calceolata.AAC.39
MLTLKKHCSRGREKDERMPEITIMHPLKALIVPIKTSDYVPGADVNAGQSCHVMRLKNTSILPPEPLQVFQTKCSAQVLAIKHELPQLGTIRKTEKALLAAALMPQLAHETGESAWRK